MNIKSILVCALVMTAFAAARADEIPAISGSATLGNFQNGTPPGGPVFGPLSYSDGLFGPVATSGGFAAIGGVTVGNNFGTFDMGTGGSAIFTGTFSLLITFFAPPNSGGGTFTSTITGNVNGTAGGFAIISWGTPQLFTFSYGNVSGSFTLSLNTVSVTPGQVGVPITGQITGGQQTVPDGGSTVALLGIAVAGMAALRRKLGLA